MGKITPKKTLEKAAAISRSYGLKKEKRVEVLRAKGKIDRSLYLEWLAIPAMLKILPDAELHKMGFDTDDTAFMKMVRTKTKKEFCREFGVSVNMPAIWEKGDSFYEELNSLSQRKYVMKFRKDVDFAFTQKTLRFSDAPRMKLWKQLNEGWSEREEHVNMNLNITPADLVAEIERRNAEIRGGDLKPA